MPTPAAVSAETIKHLEEVWLICKPWLWVFGVLVGTIISLIVWAWKQMEKSQAKLEDLVTKHIVDDDGIHDTLFSQQRDSDAKLNELIGEHKVRHLKGD